MPPLAMSGIPSPVGDLTHTHTHMNIHTHTHMNIHTHTHTHTHTHLRRCSNISLLQSCLSKITLIREKDLDKARLFFDMLLLSDEVCMCVCVRERWYSHQGACNLMRHAPGGTIRIVAPGIVYI